MNHSVSFLKLVNPNFHEEQQICSLTSCNTLIVAQKRTYPTSQKRSRARRRCVVIAHNAMASGTSAMACSVICDSVFSSTIESTTPSSEPTSFVSVTLLSKKNPWVPTMALLVHHTLKGFFRPSTTWQGRVVYILKPPLRLMFMKPIMFMNPKQSATFHFYCLSYGV